MENDQTEEVVEDTERLKVKFNPRNTKLVLITKSKDNELKLEKYIGIDKKVEAHIEITDEVTIEGIKEVIEELRAM